MIRVHGYAGPLLVHDSYQGATVVHYAYLHRGFQQDSPSLRIACHVNERGKADGGDRGVNATTNKTLVTCKRCAAKLDVHPRGESRFAGLAVPR